MTAKKTLLCTLLFLPSLGQASKRSDLFNKPNSDASAEEKAGTIRRYLWYSAWIITPQVLAKFGFFSPEGANLCSAGSTVSAIGDLGEFDTVKTIGEQAQWAAIAHELLRFQPLNNGCNNLLNAFHAFMGKLTGNAVVEVNATQLNKVIAVMGLGNLLRKLKEYW